MFEAQLDMIVAVSENQVTPINGNFNMFNMYIYIYRERVDIMIKQQIEFQCQVTSLAIAISMEKLKL